MTPWSFPLAAAPVDDGEFLLDTTVTRVLPDYNQVAPAVAAGGGNSLVVWENQAQGSTIYASRVNQSGICLDPVGISLSDSPGTQRAPAAAFNGTSYLVVWHDYRNGSASDIYGARLDQDGNLLDSAGVAICSAGGIQRYASVASDGNGWLVTWQDWRNGDSTDVYAARVDAQGVVLDPNGIPVSTATGLQQYPAVTFGGANYLVVWQDRSTSAYFDIYGARVSPSGQVYDPNGFVISGASNSQRHPAAAFDGTDYFVAWQDRVSGDSSDIYGARVTQAAVVLDPAGIPISTAANTQEHPAIAFDGSDYLVAWQDKRSWDSADVYGARVDVNGNVLEPEGIPVSLEPNTQDHVGLAFDGRTWLCAWEDRRDDSLFRAYTTQITSGGNVVNPVGAPLLSVTNRQTAPAVAWNGSEYLAIWQDEQAGAGIRGVRIDPAGNVDDSLPITISASGETPSVTAVGDVFLAVWQEPCASGYDILGARIDHSGHVLDPTGIPICSAIGDQTMPCAGSDGNQWLVVWADGRNGHNLGIYAARVNRDGVVLDTSGIAIEANNYDHRSPSVAFNQGRYLIAWQDWRTARFYNIYAARLDTSGVLLDSSSITVATGNYFQEDPASAGQGSEWLVVWEDQRGASSDIYAARVTRAGVVLDSTGLPIATLAADEHAPAVTVTVGSYLVVWEAAGDILGAQVGSDGRVTDSFPMAVQAGDQVTPAVTADQFSNPLLIYSGWAGVVQNQVYGAMRVWGRFAPWTGVGENKPKPQASSPSLLPAARRLGLSAWPNPFRDMVNLRLTAYSLQPELRIYDVSGMLVRRFFIPHSAFRIPHCFAWDGTDDSGRTVAPGVYYARLIGDERTVARLVKLE